MSKLCTSKLQLVNILIYEIDSHELLLDTALIVDLLESLKNPCTLFEKLLYNDIAPNWDLSSDESQFFEMRMTPILNESPNYYDICRIRTFEYNNEGVSLCQKMYDRKAW